MRFMGSNKGVGIAIHTHLQMLTGSRPHTIWLGDTPLLLFNLVLCGVNRGDAQV